MDDVRKIERIVEEFDSKYLVTNDRGEYGYDSSILPFVKAMKIKLESYIKAPVGSTPRKEMRTEFGRRGSYSGDSTLRWWYDDRLTEKPWEHYGATLRQPSRLQGPRYMSKRSAQKEYLVYKALLDMLLDKKKKQGRRGVNSKHRRTARSKYKRLDKDADNLRRKLKLSRHSGHDHNMIASELDNISKMGGHKGKKDKLEATMMEMQANHVEANDRIRHIELELRELKESEDKLLTEKADGLMEVDILKTEADVIKHKIENQVNMMKEAKQQYEDALKKLEQLRTDFHKFEELKYLKVNELLEGKESTDKGKFMLMEEMANLSLRIRELEQETNQLSKVWNLQHKDFLIQESRQQLLNAELAQEEKHCQQLLHEVREMEKQIKDIMKQYLGKERTENEEIQELEDLLHRHELMQINPANKIKPKLSRFAKIFYRDQYRELVRHGMELNSFSENEGAKLRAEFSEKHEYEGNMGVKHRKKLQLQMDDYDRANEDLKSKQWVLGRERERLITIHHDLDDKLSTNEHVIKKLTQQLDKNPIHLQQDAQADFAEFLKTMFKGDYLQLGFNRAIIKIIGAYEDDEKILFSDHVQKVNRYNMKQKRIVVVSSHGLYVFHTDFKLNRRIDINDINSVSLSKTHTNVLVVHHKMDYDYLFLAPKRDELLNHLFERYHMVTGRRLTHQFGDHLYVADKDLHHRPIDITDERTVKFGKSMLFETHKHEGH
jgi:hypothetical protein